MEGRPTTRRRRWVKVALVAIGLPVLMFAGLMLWIGLSLSGSY